jgi:glycolate oxidase iron-sulfur subunit
MLLPPIKDLSQQTESQSELERLLTQCVRCGTCLPTCPTYQLTKKESNSPRGRISLVRALHDAENKATKNLSEILQDCLECRACESACPNSVIYSQILEEGREAFDRDQQLPASGKFFKWLFLDHLFRSTEKLRLLMGFIRFYHKSGMRWLVGKLQILKLFPWNLHSLEKMVPENLGQHRPVKRSSDYRLIPAGKVEGKVSFFTGCIADHWMQAAHHASIKLLLRAGYTVEIPSQQECCGALHVHLGSRNSSSELASENIAAFSGSDQPIILNAAGCGAHLKEYKSTHKSIPDAIAFSERIADLSEFLMAAAEKLPEPVKREIKVTYDDPCHLIHAQGISQAPRDLLKRIPGVEVIELKESSWCCGSAGVYNIVRHDTSMELMQRKAKHIAATGADILLTANPGCLFQLRLAVKEAGLEMQVMHLAEFLDSCYQGEPELAKASDLPPWL